MADDERTCPSCGARVPAGADQCDLCGTSIDGESASEEATPDAEREEADSGSSASEEASDGSHSAVVYCTQCGHENPSGANYCSQCGTELEEHSPDSTPEGARAVAADLPEGGAVSSEADDGADGETEAVEEEQAVGHQLLWMVGIGVAVVLTFFFVTQWSQQYEWEQGSGNASPTAAGSEAGGQGRPAARSGGPATGTDGGRSPRAAARTPTSLSTLVDSLGGPVSGAVAGKIDSLRALETEASGRRQQELRSELVRLYIGAGAPGRAAVLQKQIADSTGTVDARRRTANLLYRWMQRVAQEQGRAQASNVARHVASAYEAVVDQRPDDLDARTRMGEAYLLTNNPMKGIQAINGVLEDDSTFVPARFQKGLALLQINRLDQAVEQFEMVKTHADKQGPFYSRATRAIEVIQEQTAKQQK